MSIQRARELIKEAQQILIEAGAQLEGATEPAPMYTIVVEVVSEKTLAHHVRGWNDATPSRPIMEIYPDETNKPESMKKRIKFLKGDRLTVLKGLIKADGKLHYFFEFPPAFYAKQGERLYLDVEDVRQVG